VNPNHRRAAVDAARAARELVLAADQLRLLQQCERATGRALVDRHDLIHARHAHDLWSYARWNQRFSLVEPYQMVTT
jgi:hypothetical protein